MGSSLGEPARRITYGYGYVNSKKIHTYFEACSQSKSQGSRKVKVGKGRWGVDRISQKMI
jgi:hypothetical protein